MTVVAQQQDANLLDSPFFQHGFLEPAPPEAVCAEWETLLARAMALPLKITDSSPQAESWRQSIRNMPVLPLPSPHLLAHAHSTLTFLAHFYSHSLPADCTLAERVLPAGVAVPLMRASKALGVPPVLSYADTVFYNLTPAFFDTCSSASYKSSPARSSLDQVRATFSHTSDEAHFYLTSARIEHVGASSLRAVHTALSALSSQSSRSMSSEDDIARSLSELSADIRLMARILESVREGCEPGIYYDALRPWMRAPDGGAGLGWRLSFASSGMRAEEVEEMQAEEWVERVDWDTEEVLCKTGLAGATAAQSSIIQALDAALGLEHESNGFLHRMRTYIPRPHRRFINALTPSGLSLRSHILHSGTVSEKEGYNKCVEALREMRTVHVRIAAIYLVSPAPRVVGRVLVEKGTGGTAAIPFLKGVRDRTARAVV
ncbi:unnamed protein product [Peniophora sp. CBMAI 1063]|nr:unnamed protein product [Peniophora sp. CBMAI 1063]